jgi:hypothetical protein
MQNHSELLLLVSDARAFWQRSLRPWRPFYFAKGLFKTLVKTKLNVGTHYL